MTNYKKHSLDQLLEHLNKNPITKGIEFERSCKWFLENDPEYKQQLQKVWSWNDWPGSNGKRDTGIDLIAQDIEGKIWAIQVKAYDEDYYITKADIDSFLSASSRSDISFRLLIATTNKIGSIGRDTFADQEKPVSLCLRDKLEISPVDWMLSLTDTKFVQKNIKRPRDHQQQALNAIIKGFEVIPSKGQVHMACGTGKSLLGLWLAQKLQAQHTLVLVPSISLVSQLRRTWAENAGNFAFDSIFVCSDQTVGYKHSDERQEALEIGFPATTNAQELIQQLSSNVRPKVIFSTYHSSIVIEAACKLQPDLIFDLAIADEAHRCVGKVKSDFAIITDDNKIRAHRKLYMTATPRIYTEHVKNKAQEYECEIASMDDEEKFGPVLYRLPFSDAIQQQLLTDYQVVISVIDHDTYRDYAEKGRFINIDNYETDARKTATQLLIAQAIQKYGLKKIISFHNGVSVAQDFIQTIPKAIELLPQDERPQIDYYNVVHGEQSQSERYKILKNFDNPDFTGAVIVGNDRCLREGVDIPALDGIVFADPKNSEVDIIQAVGRAIRLSGDKKIGTIIIPVFVDKQSQGVEDLENSCFKKIWQIIKALRAHDDVLAEELDNIRLELGKRSYKAPAKLPSKIITDVSVKIDADFPHLIQEKLIEGIIEKCTSNWNYQFSMLKEFRRIYPNRWPNKRSNSDEKILGMWCGTQRKMYKKNKLTLQQIKLLNDLDFTWDCLNDTWSLVFENLCKFRDINVNKWPSTINECPEIGQLGRWCGTQRKMYKNNKLSLERIDLLDSIGFVWDEWLIVWHLNFQELCKFRKTYLDKWPSQKSIILHEKKLGQWCSIQRDDFQKNNLEQFKIELLKSIGFIWDAIDNQWHTFYNKVKVFRFYHPTKWPSCKSHNFEERSLGMWCGTQRKIFKKDQMDPIRVNLLTELGFVFDPFADEWDKQFTFLSEFRKININRWPTRDEEFPIGNNIGYWSKSQRDNFRNNTLTVNRKKN